MQNLWQNPVVLKVHNGTQRSDVHLCSTCRYGLHIQSAVSGNETLRCNATTPATVIHDDCANPNMRVLIDTVEAAQGLLDPEEKEI